MDRDVQGHDSIFEPGAIEAAIARVRSDDALAATLGSRPLGIVVFDAQLRCVSINDQFAAVVRTAPEKLIGRRTSEAFPGFAQTDELLQRVLDTGEDLHDLHVTGEVRPRGPKRTFSASFFPLRSDDGTEVHGVICVSVAV